MTYAVFGDAMSYWQFFSADAGWGRVPVWGFADVEASQVEGPSEGDRVYGYLPMATHLVVTPSRISEGGFVDAAPHRKALPPVYNQYQRVTVDSEYGPKREREYAILRPLFMTSFLIDDWLADDEMFGAESVLLASASSKTALGLAQLLSTKRDVEVVGLTSSVNAEFVRSVGYYDHAVEYDEIGDLPADRPTVFVDMAGGGRVLGDALTCLARRPRSSSRPTAWSSVEPTGDRVVSKSAWRPRGRRSSTRSTAGSPSSSAAGATSSRQRGSRSSKDGRRPPSATSSRSSRR